MKVWIELEEPSPGLMKRINETWFEHGDADRSSDADKVAWWIADRVARPIGPVDVRGWGVMTPIELMIGGDGLGSALDNVCGYNVEVTLDDGRVFDGRVTGIDPASIDLQPIDEDGEFVGDETTYGLGAFIPGSYEHNVIGINVY